MKLMKILDVLLQIAIKSKSLERSRNICQTSVKRTNCMLATCQKKIFFTLFLFPPFLRRNCNFVSANEIQLCFELDHLLCKFCNETWNFARGTKSSIFSRQIFQIEKYQLMIELFQKVTNAKCKQEKFSICKTRFYSCYIIFSTMIVRVNFVLVAKVLIEQVIARRRSAISKIPRKIAH